jgi:hypothetical protein
MPGYRLNSTTTKKCGCHRQAAVLDIEGEERKFYCWRCWGLKQIAIAPGYVVMGGEGKPDHLAPDDRAVG